MTTGLCTHALYSVRYGTLIRNVLPPLVASNVTYRRCKTRAAESLV